VGSDRASYDRAPSDIVQEPRVPEIIGAMLPAYALYRLFRLLLGKWGRGDVYDVFAHLASVVTATVLGGFGRRDGAQGPAFSAALWHSLLLSALAQAVVAAMISLYRLRKRRRANSN
jgi:hypothetical protein